MSGVIGVYSTKKNNIAESLFYGLTALQHRGESGAGISVAKENGDILTKGGVGLVYYLFKDELELLKAVEPCAGIGHVLYEGTTSIQPTEAPGKNYKIVFAMDGVLMGLKGKHDIIARDMFLNALEKEKNIFKASRIFMNKLSQTGSYCIVLLVKKGSNVMLVAMRDPKGIKPFCLGKRGNEYMVSSESKGLYGAGAKLIRDVEPGEVIVISKKGIKSKVVRKEAHMHCAFEWVYFADPTSIIEGKNVYFVRKKLGEMLAEKYNLDVDVVISSPDSGRGVALGYSQKAGVPFEEAVIKNPGAKRTFQVESPDERKKAARSKFFINKDVVRGKRVALGDDSVVRGTVVRDGTIHKLKICKTKKVYCIISCPPLCFPCFKDPGGTNYAAYGLFSLPVEKIGEIVAKKLGADAVCYPTVPMLQQAIGHNGLCRACMDGKYPVKKSFVKKK